MSEYQYYEFVAIDQALSPEQRSELRCLSSRARITATSFTNEYHFGDFRGDPRSMMERYFDAHLYLANWGSHHLMLAFPQEVLPVEEVWPYCVPECVEVWPAAGRTIISLSSQDESEYWEEDVEDRLSAIVGVRDELMAGDRRGLYLAWLAGVGTWERDEDAFNTDFADEHEPPVPAGLNTLTAAQQAMADFLRLDVDVLAEAAGHSDESESVDTEMAGIEDVMSRLTVSDKDTLLWRAAHGEGLSIQYEIQRMARTATSGISQGREARTVAGMLDAVAIRRRDRLAIVEAEHAAEQVRLEAERERHRQQRLAVLAADLAAAWNRVTAHIDTKRQPEYDAAVALLSDLQVVYDRAGRHDDFTHQITQLRGEHHRKPSLVQRLDTAGLLPNGRPGEGTGLVVVT